MPEDAHIGSVAPTYEMSVSGLIAPNGMWFVGLYVCPARGVGVTFPLSSAEAREMALALVEAAEKVDGMAPGGMAI